MSADVGGMSRTDLKNIQIHNMNTNDLLKSLLTDLRWIYQYIRIEKQEPRPTSGAGFRDRSRSKKETKMAKERTNAGKFGSLQRLAIALATNNSEIQHLGVSREKLEGMLAQAQEIFQQQAARTAAKQEASRQLKTLFIESERLATVLRFALKEHYGIRSEKLTEYGLQPFRGRPRKVKPEAPEQPEAPAPAAPSPAPPPTGGES